MTKEKRYEMLMTEKQFKSLNEKMEQHGFKSLADYLLFCGLNAQINCKVGPTMEKELLEISFASTMLKQGMITDEEFKNIKKKYIEKIGSQTVINPESVK